MTRLTARGYSGRNGGRAAWVTIPPEMRASTAQVCGLYPFGVGGESPMIGVPLGHNLITGSTVCCDPINWFARAHLIGNPSAFILGLPALGKSTLIRRMLIGLSAQGVRPLVLADTKPDFSDLIHGLGGQVVKMGGTQALNILDPGQMGQAVQRLNGQPKQELVEKIHQRRLDMIIGLIVLMREGPVTDAERPLLSAALRVLDESHQEKPPVLTDLLHLLQAPTDEMRAMTMDRGDDEKYRAVADPLSVSLMTLTQGELGTTFGKQTTTPLDLDAPAISVDISNIGTGSAKVRAAMMLASWNEGYAAVDAAKALADAGAGPQRRYILALDELWAVLRTGNGLVERVDALTRLNRNEGVGQIMCSHTMADLKAISSSTDRAMAKGFVERAGMQILGGLPAAELREVAEVVGLTEAEKRRVTSWSTPSSLSAQARPPGLGKFLIKVGSRPGIPVQVKLTKVEQEGGFHDTNKRWREPA